MTHKVKTYIKNKEGNIYDKQYQDDLLTDAKIKQNEAKHRNGLSITLVVISISWLIFTGYVIVACGNGCLQYDSATSVSFIIGSLAEVFALWKISALLQCSWKTGFYIGIGKGDLISRLPAIR